MPRPTLLLRLPQPCAEPWAAMTPTATGRHCAACAKTVVDFTQKTDAEVLAYFRQPGRGQTCGRFRAGQLGRPLSVGFVPLRPWQGWLAGLLLTALATPGCTSDASQASPPAAVRPPLAAPATPLPAASPADDCPPPPPLPAPPRPYPTRVLKEPVEVDPAILNYGQTLGGAPVVEEVLSGDIAVSEPAPAVVSVADSTQASEPASAPQRHQPRRFYKWLTHPFRR